MTSKNGGALRIEVPVFKLTKAIAVFDMNSKHVLHFWKRTVMPSVSCVLS